MIDKLLGIVAPHYCCGCGKIGTILCEDCKYNITSEQNSVCLICNRPTNQHGLCKCCKMPYERAWCVGERSGVLQRLVGLYKFGRVKSAYKRLGDLLDESLPDLPANTIIIPLPTVSSHVRERGYDHMLLIVKYFAKLRNLKVQQLIIRKTSTKQRQATAGQRSVQASQAFDIVGNVNPETPYLIIDDVMTTGASIKYAALSLKNAGAKHIWVAIIARQPFK